MFCATLRISKLCSKLFFVVRLTAAELLSQRVRRKLTDPRSELNKFQNGF